MLEKLLEGGVVGGGGAGFPLWKKLSVPARTLLINGAECEPLLRSDQFLMLHEPDALVEAADALARLVGASECVICLKEHYKKQYAVLTRAIERRGVRVRLHVLPTVYPIGDEQAIIREATGRIVPPLGLPGQVGCVVVSISTAVNAYYSLRGVPVTHRLVTVAGEVRRPGVYRVPIGTPLSVLLETAGGIVPDKARILFGGPMMGALVPEGEDPPIIRTCGGVLAFPAEHEIIKRAVLPLEQMRNRAKSVCIQCRTCTDLCPRFLLGHPLYPHLSMRAFAMGTLPEKSAVLCMECGVCEMYACPMGLSPREVQRVFRAQLRREGIREISAPGEECGIRCARQVPSERLAARIGVARYEFDTPDQAIDVFPAAVCIPLKQHIGVPAKAVVSVGERVETGQTIGAMALGQLGANIHASIRGTVRAIGERGISIQEEENR